MRVVAETLNDRPGSRRTMGAAAESTTTAPLIAMNAGAIRAPRNIRVLTKTLLRVFSFRHCCTVLVRQTEGERSSGTDEVIRSHRFLAVLRSPIHIAESSPFDVLSS